MKELLEASFSLVNIIPTFLMVFVMLYWLVVFLGFVDPDIDLDVEKDAEVGGNSAAGGLNWILEFFNLKQIPFMLFVSLVALPLWVMSVLFNYYTGNTSAVFSLLMLVPGLFASLLIAKVVSAPFGKLFGSLKKGTEQPGKVIGRVCVVTSTASHNRVGQCFIKDRDDTLVLNITTSEGNTIEKGKEAIIVQYSPEKRCYMVEPYEVEELN
jgi:hypothetical protein